MTMEDIRCVIHSRKVASENFSLLSFKLIKRFVMNMILDDCTPPMMTWMTLRVDYINKIVMLL